MRLLFHRTLREVCRPCWVSPFLCATGTTVKMDQWQNGILKGTVGGVRELKTQFLFASSCIPLLAGVGCLTVSDLHLRRLWIQITAQGKGCFQWASPASSSSDLGAEWHSLYVLLPRNVKVSLEGLRDCVLLGDLVGFWGSRVDHGFYGAWKLPNLEVRGIIEVIEKIQN